MGQGPSVSVWSPTTLARTSGEAGCQKCVIPGGEGDSTETCRRFRPRSILLESISSGNTVTLCDSAS